MRKDWIEIELGKVCDKATKVKRKEMPSDDSFIYLDIGGIDNISNQIVDHKTYSWKEAPSRAQQIVKIGDVLFSTVRTYLKNIAQVSNVQYQGQICSSGFTVIRGKATVLHPKYIYYYSLFEGFLQPLNELQTGTSYPAVRDNDVFAQKIPLAPLPEQRAIVSKIEQLFSELDNATTNLQSAKDKLEIYRQAVLKKAFEGEHEKSILNEVCDKIQDGSHYSPKKQSPIKEDGMYLYITSKNIRNNYMDLSNVTYVDKEFHESIYRRCDPVQGDVLLTKDGVNTGNITINTLDEPFSLLSSVCLIRPKKEILLSVYVKYYLQSPKGFKELTGKMTGTAIRRIILKRIKNGEIPVPSIQEQHQIINEIETRLSVCDNILANIEEGLEKSEALRQSILKQAFEGKLLSEKELEACKAAPDWEPAEKLLERIKSGKETSGKREKKSTKKSPKKKIHHVEYYKRTLLAAEIVWQLHKQPTLGHLKLQKLIYLCQESGNMQLPTNFLQQAAGPYDPQMARSIDKQLKIKKWFAFRLGEMLKYEPLEKAGEHQADFRKYYANDIDNIQKVIDLFKTAKSDQIEIVATLYACWKKIIRGKVVFSENLLIKRFYKWSEEKSKYPESRVKKAAEWMREKGIVPAKTEKQTVDE